MLEKLDEQKAEAEILPCMNAAMPQTTGPRGVTSGVCEINGLAVNPTTDQLFAAAGDCNCYTWDLQTQTCIGKMAGHKDYLHCVATLPRSQLAITGSEDGTMGVWDLRSSQNVGYCKGEGANPHSFVSSVAADESESWVVCGGGTDGARGKVTGHLSTWYLPSRTVTSSAESPAAIQDLTLHNNEIVSVGSEPVIRHWSKHSGEMRTKTRSTPPSIFAININPVEEYQVFCKSLPARVCIGFDWFGCIASLPLRRSLSQLEARLTLTSLPTKTARRSHSNSSRRRYRRGIMRRRRPCPIVSKSQSTGGAFAT